MAETPIIGSRYQRRTGLIQVFRARYLRILWFFARLILHLAWWDIFLPKLGLHGLVIRSRPERYRKAARRFRLLAVQMGGVMIKVGQFLSARLDVLPLEVTDELAGLQDEVAAETYDDIRQVIENEFHVSIHDLFLDFDPTPLASASIGQVHRARLARKADESVDPTDLPSSVAVVVKVQRPNIDQIIQVDLSALNVVGGWLYRYPPIRKRANVPALLDEFSRSLYEEIDYLHEGKNAEIFGSNFENRSGVLVPHIYWSHTSRRVITLEDIEAIKITDYDAIRAAGIHPSDVAKRLIQTYLQQIFEDHFFHADPHPGNLFVLPTVLNEATGETEWELVFVDFGMTGEIPPKTFSGLHEMLIGIATRDYARVIRAYQMLGILLPGANLALLEQASERLLEQLWGKSTADIVNISREEAEDLANEFGSLLYEMPFQIPENLILLGRMLGILSGICTGLDPEFNVWTNIAPYAQKMVKEESGGEFKVLRDAAIDTAKTLYGLPKSLEKVLDRFNRGAIEVRIPEIERQVTILERAMHQLALIILFATFFITGAVLFAFGHETGAYVLGGLSVVILLRAFFNR